MKKALFYGICTAILCLCHACQDPSRLEICNLRCEMLEAPLAIDNTSPHFSWEMRSKENAMGISAYQILVATEPGRLNEKEADLWNSGKVEKDASLGIVYEGKKLAPRSLAYWKVRVWNQEGVASDWSANSLFGIGILEEKDWDVSARFIGLKLNSGEEQHTPLLRKKFHYDPDKERMLLHVNSLGYHEAYINGRRVSDAVLAPAVSDFGKRSLIMTYDVTSLLKKGTNELVLWIGKGWYQEGQRGVIKGGPYVRAQLDAVTRDGAKTLVATSESWQAGESGRHTFGSWKPHQMGGEIVDQRYTLENLQPKTLDGIKWYPVTVADIPTHKATPQMCEPNRLKGSFHPISVMQTGNKSFIYDMGHNFVGFTDVKMPVVDAGQKIELHYDDFFMKDSTSFREDQYTDYYIGDGESEGSFSSKFNYKGYRYLMVKGLKDPIPLENITGSMVSTGFNGKATFACSDKDMNAIYEMVYHTLHALTLGGYMVDCPQIERLGYGGDGNASTPTAQTLFNLAPLYMNWMQAWADSQRDNGDMPHTAPNPYSAGGGPYWCGFIITASWQTYLNYGDKRLLERYYPQMQKWLEFAESHKKDGLLAQWDATEYRNWYLGDWATPTGINQTDSLSIGVVTNCFLSDCYATMAKIAKVTGRDADVPVYVQKSKELNTLIHEAYFDPEKNSYSTGTQIDLVYPMLVKATPEDAVGGVKQTLYNETAQRFKGHLSTGLVGVPVLTQWAIENGEAEFMYQMLKKREYPGYLYMIDNGATLTWEHWNGSRSRIHNCYNGIGRWFHQALAGIMPDEKQPGYKHINIRPQLVEGITWVKASKNTSYGPVAVNWNIENNVFTLNVEIPAGSTATLSLPAGAEQIEVIPAIKETGASMTLPSGQYEIICQIQGK